jgi:hypothetical protein
MRTNYPARAVSFDAVAPGHIGQTSICSILVTATAAHIANGALTFSDTTAHMCDVPVLMCGGSQMNLSQRCRARDRNVR